MDMINPNNLMVDYINKEINYIDLPSQKQYSKLESPKNSICDMICVLCNSLLHDEYYKVLNESDKGKLSLYRKFTKIC